MIVYVSIGNSDDKLTQQEWAEFQGLIGAALTNLGRLHGEWVSLARSRFQNACWCVEFEEPNWSHAKARVKRLAATYRQDSVAVAHVEHTQFLGESE